jgi:putative DNA primase/helicase
MAVANRADHKTAAPMLTFEELRQGIINISSKEDREVACVEMIRAIAAANPSPVEASRLAGLLRNAYPDPKPPRKFIEQDIKNFRRLFTGARRVSTAADTEHQILQYLLDELFEGGKTLKRFAKTYWSFEKGVWAMCDEERIDGQLWNLFVRIRSERSRDISELVAAIDDRNTSSWLLSLARGLKGHLAEREGREDPLQLLRRFPLPVVNTRNCEIWFNAEGQMERREHDPDNFLTTQVACEYEPDAECPEWDRFCGLIFSECSDPEGMQRHLEELGGYTISMSRWLKTWVLLKGPKDTGKSSFTEVLNCMLGSAALSQDLGRFGKRANQFTNTALVGKLALVDDDFAKRSVLPDGFLKTISEEKSLSTEKKYGDVFRFVCRSLPIICSNHWPKTSDLSDAIRERAVVFPFSHKIVGSERSDQRRAAMLEELPGILNRFLSGLSRLRARGDWDHPQDCIEARKEWTRHSNIVALFAHDCIRENCGTTLLAKTAWDAFRAFCREESGSHRHQIGRDTFYLNLDSLIGKRRKIGGNQLAYSDCELVIDSLED